MRISDERYSRDLRRYNLAVKLLSLEARTGTISRLTGLSEARVRRLGSQGGIGFSAQGSVRHRGPAPYRMDVILGDARLRSEATALAALVVLLEIRLQARPANPVEYCEGLCALYDAMGRLLGPPLLSFEQMLLVYQYLARQLLWLRCCKSCGAMMLQDALEVVRDTCRACKNVRMIPRWASDTGVLRSVEGGERSAYQYPLF